MEVAERIVMVGNKGTAKDVVVPDIADVVVDGITENYSVISMVDELLDFIVANGMAAIIDIDVAIIEPTKHRFIGIDKIGIDIG